MLIKELKENESLEMIEIFNYTRIPNSPGVEDAEPQIVEEMQVGMIIYTDGVLDSESEEVIRPINGSKSENDNYLVNTLKIKKVCLKNYNYIIVYQIANELTNIGGVGGFFPIVKDVSIYLKNINDKKALNEAKKIIKQNEEDNRNVDYSSLWTMLFSSIKNNKKFYFEKSGQNIYTLTKKK